tara:strand:- start:588 stop:1295 length:708 start_codon:yes stop_codon:yes gene_type:complete
MNSIVKAKSISIWIFIVPFVAVNACLLITTQFHSLIESQYRIYMPFPYVDGGVSISRTARYFPTYLIFKPAMFLTSYLLIIYWLSNKKIIEFFEPNHKNRKKIIFFGVASAIALILHAIFLGVKFDNDIYKLFRRVIMFTFIVFEIVAQAYLVITLFSFKEKLDRYINKNVLKFKLYLVSLLIIVAVISVPIISLPGDNFFGFNLKFLKHALEWDYFLGVIAFYLLTFFMWKKTN